jgi:hypothetical protein
MPLPTDRRTASRSHKGWIVAAALAGILAVVGCDTMSNMKDSMMNPDTPTPCPPNVNILPDAARLTQYQPGNGRDLTDVTMDARIDDIMIGCTATRSGKLYTGLQVNLRLVIVAERGPADRTRSADISYFIAMPQFYPKDQAKQTFRTRLQFPGNRTKITVVEPDVNVTIPLKPNEIGENYDILVGFDLTREEVEDNRARGTAQ